MLGELSAMPNVRLVARTTAIGWYDDMVFGAVERVQEHVATPDAAEPTERFWRIVARRALLCTGAEERPIVFGGNDRPGVMLAEAGLAYARRYGVAVGACVGVFTTNDGGLLAARGLKTSGVEIAEVVDARNGAVVTFDARRPIPPQLRD